MKATFIITFFFLSFFQFACTGSSNRKETGFDSSLVLKTPLSNSFPKGKIINSVVCQSDPSQSYALYIPKDSNSKPLPIVYFFDPHGDGLLPVKKYQSLADSFHFILVGSNNSKNGNNWNDAETIWNELSDDVQKRVAVIPDRMYTAGFSGGAKVATFIALSHHNISGVIANGAGLEDITTAGDLNFSFTAITGKGDMNMTDLVAIDTILDKTLTRHRIIFFDGIHEWAPVNTMNIAFDGLRFDAMLKNLIPQDTAFIESFINRNKEMITGAEKKNDYIKAQEICLLSAAMLDNVTSQSDWFHQEEDSILHTNAYQKQEQVRQNLLRKEENIKTGFQQKFQTGDDTYWNKAIADVKTRAKGKSPEAAMYQRLQAFLSLAFYSISNQFINQNQNKEAEHFVTLYKKADPTNSEGWYFSAILDARNDKAQPAKNDLLKAVSLGFNDKKRLEQQPEFTNSHIQINLQAIERRMK